MPQHRQIGVAVVGAGRIGAMRAHLAAAHPAVRFLAVSDADPRGRVHSQTKRRRASARPTIWK